jgi:hypothetical protein
MKPWRTPTHALLESDVENPAKSWLRDRGWWVRKFKSPGNRSVPDDVMAKASRVIWVEFKRPGNKPTEKQAEQMKLMRAAGLEVYWFDNLEAFKQKFLEIEKQMKYEAFLIHLEPKTLAELSKLLQAASPNPDQVIKAELENLSCELDARLQKLQYQLPTGQTEPADTEEDWLL